MAHLPLWYISQVPPDQVLKAHEEFKAYDKKAASMDIDGNTLDKEHRDTTVSFINKDHWFGLQMFNFVSLANRECKWGYHLEDHEAVQYAEYGSKQHYNWHTDFFPLSGKDYDRKITVVCLLNDPSEFEGGDFEIRMRSTFKAPLEKGTIIAFPSILEHRVVPIISGLRCSATMWVNGPRFR